MWLLPRPLKPTVAMRIWLLTSARARIGSTLKAAAAPAAPAACFKNVRRVCPDIRNSSCAFSFIRGDRGYWWGVGVAADAKYFALFDGLGKARRTFWRILRRAAHCSKFPLGILRSLRLSAYCERVALSILDRRFSYRSCQRA